MRCATTPFMMAPSSCMETPVAGGHANAFTPLSMGPKLNTASFSSLSHLFTFRCHFVKSWVAVSFQQSLPSSLLGGLSEELSSFLVGGARWLFLTLPPT